MINTGNVTNNYSHRSRNSPDPRLVFDAFTKPELIVPPERSVHMESFDDFPGESQVTTVLVEHEGKTTLTATLLYPSQEIRDAVINSGMEHGAAESYDKLADLLANEVGQAVSPGGFACPILRNYWRARRARY